MAEKYRNRIKELRYVRAGELIPDERNWRIHPDGQRRAMQEVLDTVGWADTAIARETADGLMLVDGHLRASLDDDEQIPVLIVDLSDAEAATVMATMDPISTMIEIDTSALQGLLDNMPKVGPILEGHLNDMLNNPLWTPDSDRTYVEGAPPEQTELDKSFRVICPAGMAGSVGDALRMWAEQFPEVRVI